MRLRSARLVIPLLGLAFALTNQHGGLPEKLDELTPSLLAEVPEDPFTGAELEYRRTDKGYLIYSVGRDRKDDGGLEEADKKQSADGKSYDLPFIVER